MLGYEDFYSSWETLMASRDQFALTYYPYLDQGSDDFRDNGGNKLEYAYHSYFGRVTYSFDNRYLLPGQPAPRRSSRFASECRWATFPSVSAGWVLSQEKFFANAGMDWWNLMKIRASWGKLGNERIGSYYPYQASLNFYNALLQNGNGRHHVGRYRRTGGLCRAQYLVGDHRIVGCRFRCRFLQQPSARKFRLLSQGYPRHASGT